MHVAVGGYVSGPLIEAAPGERLSVYQEVVKNVELLEVKTVCPAL